MRWLFAALILANIGAWMWGQWYQGRDDTAGRAQPQINAERMKLLSEPGAAPVARPAQARVAGCYSLGPFGDEQAVADARSRLDAVGVEHQARSIEERQASGHRVFLAPLRTAKLAERKRKELARLGLRDLYVMQDGPKRNGISLGVFSSAKAADEYQHKLAELGVAAERDTLFRTRTRHWLDLGRLDAPRLEQIRQQAWPAGVTAQAMRCPKPVTDRAGNAAELP